jgi:hypothetical protein
LGFGESADRARSVENFAVLSSGNLRPREHRFSLCMFGMARELIGASHFLLRLALCFGGSALCVIRN